MLLGLNWESATSLFMDYTSGVLSSRRLVISTSPNTKNWSQD